MAQHLWYGGWLPDVIRLLFVPFGATGCHKRGIGEPMTSDFEAQVPSRWGESPGSSGLKDRMAGHSVIEKLMGPTAKGSVRRRFWDVSSVQTR